MKKEKKKIYILFKLQFIYFKTNESLKLSVIKNRARWLLNSRNSKQLLKYTKIYAIYYFL
jgi:hypothetical protein